MVIKSLKRVFAIVMLSGMAITAFADNAPVYDVDNYPPQFDGQSDAGTPAPGAVPASSSVPSDSQGAVQTLPPSSSLDQRVNRMEQQMKNLQHSDSSSRMNTLQNEVQSLRGQVEELTHQLQQMQTQQRSMYSDLDKRIGKQSATPPADNTSTTPAKTPPKKTSSTKKAKAVLTTDSIPAADEPAAEDKPVTPAKQETPAVATPVTATASKPESAAAQQAELQMYQSAYDLIKDSKFDQAIGVLQAMLKKYPSGQSAANAHYWLGELYGLQKKREEAAVEFSTVVTNYPESPKVSDAELKLGMIYAAQFKWPEARATFKKVITRYPGTTSARLAAQQLKEIKSGGH
ncbi:MAG TPA: tol-pal system protein YbgF [Gammaproteobacteria bacterium]|nr:tol-pal system protein YbgF [Gammaproteobacteria bacterium]